MEISMIAAIGKNNELGKDNELIFHLRRDMMYFRETTNGKTVIMGRKTFDSLPRVLPNRRNIVISRNKMLKIDGAEVCQSVEEALELCKNDNVFVIGGGKIYGEFFKYADKLYITEINAERPDADTFFPIIIKDLWHREVLSEDNEDGIDFKFTLYKKIVDKQKHI